MIVLIQEYYEPDNKERLLEIRETLQINLKNESISKIYLLNEKKYDHINELINDKIVQVITDSRLTFKKAFEYANKIITDKETITIISNNDIYFNDTESIDNIKYVLLDNPNTVIALSRNDIMSNFSQDIWIFKGPIKIPEKSDFNLGLMGCDNKIAYCLNQMGYRLRNLPYDIIAVHNHKSKFRTYNKDNVLPGPHLFVDVERIRKPIIHLNDTSVIVTYIKCG